jgi:N-acetyl-anhydromuramyl-L-alanine amidase AmpD
VGRFDDHPPPTPQLEVGARLIRDLLTVFDLSPLDVVGHREVTPNRTCPGRAFPLDRLRFMIDGTDRA